MLSLSNQILSVMERVPRAPAYWVAFSGGLDSRVLLQALAEGQAALGGPLGAVHVDHGLHPESSAWADHCAQVCSGMGLPYVRLAVNGAPKPGESPEAAARRARYTELARWLPAGCCVLSAHHRDDQAETLLLQLLRGGGPRGLAAMPLVAPLGRGILVRPLLGLDRGDLRRYAQARGLQWLDDPSNMNTDYDRNFLRHDVLPPLRARWPSAAGSLARSAAHCAEAAELLDTLAAADLESAWGGPWGTLALAALTRHPPARQRNLLRYWLRQQGVSVPSAAVLNQILLDMPGARADGEPRVAWRGGEVRRYRDNLYALSALPPVDVGAEYLWRPGRDLEIPAALGILEACPVIGEGLAARFVTDRAVTIRFRRGGETFRPPGRAGRHALKKLFQEAGVPPWERQRVPLVYIEGELGAVAGFWVGERFQAREQEPGLALRWSRWSANS